MFFFLQYILRQGEKNVNKKYSDLRRNFANKKNTIKNNKNNKMDTEKVI